MATSSLMALITTASTLALPQSTTTTGGTTPLVPDAVGIHFYQSPWAPTSESCGMQVSNGTLKANKCTPLCVEGVSVAQAPANDCVFTVYKGTETCTGAYEMISYAIGAGENMVCVDVGVEQGCRGTTGVGEIGASGMWSCG